jgi:hypothetical protein
MGKKVSGVEGFRAADLVNPERGRPVVPGKLNEAGFREHVDAEGADLADVGLRAMRDAAKDWRQAAKNVLTWAEGVDGGVDFKIAYARDCLETMADANHSDEVFQAVSWPMEVVRDYILLLMKIKEQLGEPEEKPEGE